MGRTDSLEKTLMLGKIEGGKRRGNRGWDGGMASPTQWTWVWVNSGSWWRTGRPGVLLSMGSQRVGHDWVTELNWTLGVKTHTAQINFCCWFAQFCPRDFPGKNTGVGCYSRENSLPLKTSRHTFPGGNDYLFQKIILGPQERFTLNVSAKSHEKWNVPDSHCQHVPSRGGLHQHQPLLTKLSFVSWLPLSRLLTAPQPPSTREAKNSP